MIYKQNNKSGSTFIVVIGVLAVIIFAATMFMTSTIEEGRQTSMSIRGLHATSLAEASLERAMRILAENINKVEPDKAKPTDLGILLRLPATEGSSNLGQSENLGVDKELNLTEAIKKEIVLTKDDLQPNDEKELDELVTYMAGEGGVKSYEVAVKAKITQAFRNSPGKDYAEYKIPGVDIGWNTRYDVKNFLEGNGITAFELKLPKGLKWLSFSIPIKIGSIKLVDINVTSIVGKLLPPINIGGTNYSFDQFTEFDTLAKLLLNNLIGKGKNIYPVEIKVDKVNIPKSVAELWPSGTSVSEGSGQYLEKYGQISFECEAKITYNDNYTSARRVTAVKDFKVADCEPPAPMYSFFINNTQNEYISFNHYGGQFFVNNYDYTGIFGKLKESIFGSPNQADDDLESREFPGLIRVNYKDISESRNRPILCNIGLVGDWGSPTIKGDDGGTASKVFAGAEALMLLCPDNSMAIAGAKYNVNAAVNVKNPETNEKIPVKLRDTYKKGAEIESPLKGTNWKDYSAEFNANRTLEKPTKAKAIKEALGLGGGSNGINLVPNVGEMSTNVISLAITLALRPLVGMTPLSGVLKIPNCFQEWDMPAMGTSNSVYPIPTTGTGSNKTHLFGYSGLHPTLTKEIEGNVMKVYRQWGMCIVGMNPTDRLPLLPFPPVFLPPPPLVVPIWKAAEIIQKYDFNLENFKAQTDSGEAETAANEYDPELLENMPPNLYTNEQYAKKATYYYETPEAFIEDLENRITEIDGKKVFILNGITYISGTLGEASNPFAVDGADTLYVAGKGMIICSGNIYLGCSIETLDRSSEERTVFSLMCRKGGLLVMQGGKKLRIEGSLYTERGLYIHPQSSLHIVGNWVTNAFSKPAMSGTVVVDYASSRVRTSLGSLHPTRGKYDPRRYHVSFSPVWAAWRAH